MSPQPSSTRSRGRSPTGGTHERPHRHRRRDRRRRARRPPHRRRRDRGLPRADRAAQRHAERLLRGAAGGRPRGGGGHRRPGRGGRRSRSAGGRPDRGQGRRVGGGRRDDRRFARAARLPPRRHRDAARAAARGRRHRGRPDQHPRVLLPRHRRQPALRTHLQPVGSAPRARRLLGRCRCRRGRRHGAARDRLRRRRLDPHPRLAVRCRRLQGDLRRRAARAAVARLVLAHAPRSAGVHGRRLRPDDRGDGRTRSARSRPRCPTSATTSRQPGGRRATSTACASPTPRISATCASTAASARRSAPRWSGSASWAPSWNRPSPTSRTRSTPGTPSPASTTSSRRARCSTRVSSLPTRAS